MVWLAASYPDTAAALAAHRATALCGTLLMLAGPGRHERR
jgi:hypothetical protein